MFGVSPQRRIPLTIALLVGLIVVGTIVNRSHGPAPDKGATYTGTVVVPAKAGSSTKRNLPISFTVDRSGTHVGDVHFSRGLPTTCPSLSAVSSVSTTVSAGSIITPSRFNFTLPIHLTATPDTVIGTLQMSGEFHTFHREGGAIATTFTKPSERICGTGSGYFAKS